MTRGEHLATPAASSATTMNAKTCYEKKAGRELAQDLPTGLRRRRQRLLCGTDAPVTAHRAAGIAGVICRATAGWASLRGRLMPIAPEYL
jgi:hypothetical protein